MMLKPWFLETLLFQVRIRGLSIERCKNHRGFEQIAKALRIE
jgi:hypothetical protein